MKVCVMSMKCENEVKKRGHHVSLQGGNLANVYNLWDKCIDQVWWI